MSRTAGNTPRPFLKWAGGKQQLLDQLHRRLPKVNYIKDYYEIFAGGGGALFFSLVNRLRDRKHHISDSNRHLIETYIAVRDEVEAVIEPLQTYENTPEFFEYIRAWDRQPDFDARSFTERASRIIYLNKTCFNGLFRVNSTGHFNVPFGRYKNPNICDERNLRACSEALQHVTIKAADYWELVDSIKARDFVYLDPPYEPVSATSSFRAYTKFGFDEVEQTRLFKFCQELTKKRALFMLSNSAVNWLKNLYEKEPAFNVQLVDARRSINADKNGRGPVKEIVVRNYRA